jgi:RNA polymerase sigma factor (sigma-70 family)
MGKRTTRGPEWLREAVTEFENRLIRYARQMTGDLELARDAVQETFLRLCNQAPDTVQDHLAAWLFSVCRSRALDLIKARKPQLDLEEVEDLPSGDGEPSLILEHKEKLEQAMRLLERLPAHQQEVIRLKFQQGFSYKEISSITGLSVSNVGFLIHVGIKTMKHELEVQTPPKERIMRRIK